MLHLSAERLAALADTEPTATEAVHLSACDACAAERDAYRRLLAHAGAEAYRIAPPLTTWEGIAAGLAAERDSAGSPVAGVTPAVRRRALPAWARRAAAVVVLVGGGVLAGRVSAGAPAVPGLPAGAVAAADTAAPELRSPEEALAVLARAERDFRAAAAFLAAEREDDPLVPESAEAYRARLAALDEVASITRAALYDAPHDPVINQYYLASLGAREATLRQLGASLPMGVQLNRF